MGLRPTAANWFEMLVAREDLMAAVDLLAQSSRVELEGRGEPCAPLLPADARELLGEFDALERSYGTFWPPPRARPPDDRCEPRTLLERAVQQLRDWREQASATVDRLRNLELERGELELVASLFRHAGDRLPDLEQLSTAGPMLEARLYLLGPGGWPGSVPASLITQRLNADEQLFLLAVGLPEDVETLGQQLQAQKARPLRLPENLPARGDEALAAIVDRLAAIQSEIDTARGEIDALNERFEVADAVASAAFVRWYVEQVPDLASTEHFAWISGWTSFPDEDSLLALLAEHNVKGLLRLSEPPAGLELPLILSNPRWMQPFELFTGMLGVPGSAEADPTRIVALAAPLMFGYMFGDVGHGAVLLAAGLVLGRRYPALKLLIAGGAVSIVFGFLYGSVFAIETLLEPLWVRPLEDPILIMLVPLVGGAAVLLTGMLLDALQAYWQHRGRRWWETGGGLLLCYLALLGSLFDARLLLVAVLGFLWFVAGHAFVVHAHRLAAAGAALTEFLESMLQVLVNTLSFVRVGAFALAHSGLSLAVIGMAETPSSLTGKLLVLVFGNAVIIALEGLVAGIQTTRLVLFEFFVRFLRAEGRPFRPILPPLTPRQQRRHT